MAGLAVHRLSRRAFLSCILAAGAACGFAEQPAAGAEPSKTTKTSPEKSPKETPAVKGEILLIGGGPDDRFLENFVRLLPEGKKGVIAMTLSSSRPEVTWNAYKDFFLKCGASEVFRLHPKSPKDTQFSEDLEKMFRKSGLLFGCGGDQGHVVGGVPIPDETGKEAPVPSWLYQRIHRFVHEGGTYAGNSAGTAVGGKWGPYQNSASSYRGRNELPGFGFLEAVVDQHLTEHGRMPRFLEATRRHPEYPGFGIDRETAALFDGNTVKASGRGNVFIAVNGRVVKTLKNGDSFDLRELSNFRKYNSPLFTATPLPASTRALSAAPK